MSLPGELRVVPHVPTAFQALVEELRPRSFALSGGDTARQCYELLAVADVDWSVVDILFGDERWVPLGDSDSNETMARFAFVDTVMPAAVHSLRHAGDTIEAAAANYDALLRSHTGVECIHLGLGPDCHTASLFPGTAALDERERLVVPNGDDLHPHPRLTFTFPAIERCGVAVFTVAGAEKRAALDRVKAGEDVPAARVRAGRVIWLVDPAADGSA
jgi:6-phosphogluconolactonase